MSGYSNAGIKLTGRIMPFLICILAFISSGVTAQSPKVTPRTIRVVMDNDYAPYVFLSGNGQLQGILIDQWKEWENKTGIKVEIAAMDWSEAVQRMQAGEFDVIDCIVETAGRQDDFDFTPAYNTIHASIYFRNSISGVSDLASLKGFPVGVKTGDQHIDKLKANGISNLILFNNNDAIIESAKKHTINVFVADDLSALYLLNKSNIESEFRHSAPVFQDELRRAVRKGNTVMLSTVTEGFAAIDPDKLMQIHEKWFGRTINKYGEYLRFLGYTVYAVALAILLIAGLAVWNQTLRKQILLRTAALSGSEERFRQIADNIHEVFWLIDRTKQTVLYISPAYESVWGRFCEHLYKDLHSFTDAIHPDDKDQVMERMEKQSEPDELEYRILRPDGSVRWIWDRSFPVKDESGHIYRIAGIAEDITERKEAEERLRHSESQLAEAQRLAHIGSWDWNLKNDTVNWSEELYRIFGATSSTLNPGRDALAFVHPEDQERVMNTVYAAIKHNEPFSFHYRIIRPEGEERIVHSRGQLVKNKAGETIRVLGATQDITESKQAEDALQLSFDEIRRLTEHLQKIREEERIHIAREIHDELGQQLTAIKMDVAWVDKQTPESSIDIKRKLKNIIGLLDGSYQSVRRILSELRPQILDDHGLPEAIEWLGRQFSEATGVPVTFTAPEKDIRMSPQMATSLFRVCQEAFTNITRYAYARKILLSIRIDRNNIVLVIEDDGTGFDTSAVSHKKTFGILGMKERVISLGGIFTLDSRPSKGTTITVSLPYQESLKPA
jgi:PAS domain S-box-containing protein